ncbi:MAG: hypothetical protein ACRETC_10485 [Gammaproteobacteria bacterium]
MTLKPWLVACIAIFAAAPALAQSPPAKPLNLDLDLQFTPATASTTHGKAKVAPASKPRQQGAHPDDTRDTAVQPPYAYPPACDNKAYKKPQIFGNVELGAFAGSHFEGSYQAVMVGIAKALGSCDHPSGNIIFSLGVGRETINGPGWPR